MSCLNKDKHLDMMLGISNSFSPHLSLFNFLLLFYLFNMEDTFSATFFKKAS